MADILGASIQSGHATRETTVVGANNTALFATSIALLYI